MKTRPSLLTPELADRILGGLRTGRTLLDICQDDGMPHPVTVAKWAREDREGFAALYRQARQAGHGRPGYVRFSPEIVDAFLDQLMAGRTLVDVCRDPAMPEQTTISTWVARDREGFAERYRAARQVGKLRRAPVPYDAEIAEQLLAELATGRTIEEICSEPDMPGMTSVYGWIRHDHDGFRVRYWEARQIACYAWLEQMPGIVDDRRNDWIAQRNEDGSTDTILDPDRVNRAKLRIKTRWRMLKIMAPKAFGHRPDGHAPPRADNGLAEMLRLIDGRSRGLPSEDQPLDHQPLNDGQFDDGSCDDK
jgi:hypothetical protein